MPDSAREALLERQPQRPVQPQIRFYGAAVPSQATARSTIRTTSIGGHWDADTTWQGAVAPTAADSVVIASGATVHLDVDGQRSCAHLTIDEEATLVGYWDALLGAQAGITNHGSIQPDASGTFGNEPFTMGTQGAMVNTGAVVADQAQLRFMKMELHGDVHNSGEWGETTVGVFGDGRRTLDFGTSQDPFLTIYGNPVTLVGDNRLPQFIVHRGGDFTAQLVIDSEASLSLASDAAEETFVLSEAEGYLANYGSITVAVGEDRSAYAARVEWAEPGDSAHVTTYGTQVPASYGNALWRWWRIEPAPGSEDAQFASLELLFTESDIGPNDPADVHVYHSSDGGKSWSRVSDENTIRRTLLLLEGDAGAWGSIEVTADVPASGDYVLSDRPPVAARASVIPRLTGRSQIRIGGPPLRYSVYYVNTGSVPVGEGMIGLQTDAGIYIDTIIPSRPDPDRPPPEPWGKEIFSIDGDSTSALLVTPALAPGESRTFTMNLRAVPTEADADALIRDAVVLPVVLARVGSNASKGYLKDLAVNALEEVMADPCADFTGANNAVDRAFDKTDRQWNPFGDSEKPWLEVAKNGASEVVENSAIDMVGDKIGVLEDLKSVGDAVANGAERYEDRYGEGSLLEPIDCGDDPPPFAPPNNNEDDATLNPVRSWDPNAKTGPGGVDEAGFVSSGGEMTYQILFENKAEATAAAYQIVIVDTLSGVFDWSTVDSVAASHDGFTFTQTVDSILTWEIVGIELPPNEQPPEGEGFVEFSVSTRDDLPSGAVIDNDATITFDLNDPIVTNTHVNTLDLDPPMTTMEQLPETVRGDAVEVHWSQHDGNGSGVASTAVYASKDGGAFSEVGVSEDTSLTVSLEPDHSYRFYALSQDRVGNVELVRPAVSETHVLEGVDADDDRSFTFALYDNYPNPFNPSTTIHFELPETATTQLHIYDVLGRRVATLIDERMNPGNHRVTWEPENVGSGVYFYRLVQGYHQSTGSMVIVR